MIGVSDSGHNAIIILYFHYDGDRELTDVHGHVYLANISKILTNLHFTCVPMHIRTCILYCVLNIRVPSCTYVHVSFVEDD